MKRGRRQSWKKPGGRELPDILLQNLLSSDSVLCGAFALCKISIALHYFICTVASMDPAINNELSFQQQHSIVSYYPLVTMHRCYISVLDVPVYI